MIYFLNKWKKLKQQLQGKALFIFLDYDGTLTPIAKTPQKANIPERTKDLLKELSKSPKCKIAIISGRSLKDIKIKIGLKGIIYSGNHGLEIQGPNIKFTSPLSISYKTMLQNLKHRLQKEFSKIKGIVLEDKKLSLSIHYRLADKRSVSEIKTIFRNNIILPLTKNKIKIKYGKKITEIRPPLGFDKGKVVLWIINRQKPFFKNKGVIPIYIGDDITDEDAFEALKGKGLTIFVGRPRNSRARYYLKNSHDVFIFLKHILYMQKV